MNNDELLHKWVNGSITPEELAIFQKRPEYDSLVSLYKNTENLSSPSFNEEAMLADILKTEKTIKESKKEGKLVVLSSWIKYAAAAVVLLAASWFLWPSSYGPEQVIVEKASRFEGKLPDGSTYVLNAESKIDFDGSSWEGNREVNLKGEGFFTVKSGSTFKVLTPNGIVQVLGTQFNVRSRNNSLEVKCQSGKVAVLNKAYEKLEELVLNEAIRIQGDSINEKWKLALTEKVSWIYGLSKFNKATLSAVLEELGRQYNIEIETGNVDLSQKVNCSFQHKNIDEALKTTLDFLDIKYDYKDKRLTLEK